MRHDALPIILLTRASCVWWRLEGPVLLGCHAEPSTGTSRLARWHTTPFLAQLSEKKNIKLDVNHLFLLFAGMYFRRLYSASCNIIPVTAVTCYFVLSTHSSLYIMNMTSLLASEVPRIYLQVFQETRISENRIQLFTIVSLDFLC